MSRTRIPNNLPCWLSSLVKGIIWVITGNCCCSEPTFGEAMICVGEWKWWWEALLWSDAGNWSNHSLALPIFAFWKSFSNPALSFEAPACFLRKFSLTLITPLFSDESWFLADLRLLGLRSLDRLLSIVPIFFLLFLWILCELFFSGSASIITSSCPGMCSNFWYTSSTHFCTLLHTLSHNLQTFFTHFWLFWSILYLFHPIGHLKACN